MKSILIAMLILFYLSGCASNHLLRDKETPCKFTDKNSCKDSYIIFSEKNSYSLSFVELDEQGHFQSRSQLNNVLAHVKSRGDNQDIVLFIHGWHHNAEYSDSNVKDFNRLVKSLSDRNPTRKITGIYVGWRGESINIPYINSLTFWDRKNVSVDVGQGSLIELLYRLEIIGNEKKNSRFISIGHSFGGSVLFSSLKNEIYKRLIKSKNDANNGSFGDLVILVNPAIESIPFAPLRYITEETARNNSNAYPRGIRPSLTIFMSENDQATKLIFPIGRILSSSLENQNTLLRKNRNGDIEKYSQYWMDMKALGHYKPFVTHSLRSIDKMNGECSPTKAKWDNIVTKNIHDNSLNKNMTEGWSYIFPASNVKLKHLSNSAAYAPIWVVSVDEKIIPNHNGIFGDQFNCFIEEMLLTNE